MPRLSFTEHPASVHETYLEHFSTASGFGGRMILGGLACILHGVLPFLFLRTGSRTITQLYERMVINRSKHGSAETADGRLDEIGVRAGS
jgi:hypothetical protein